MTRATDPVTLKVAMGSAVVAALAAVAALSWWPGLSAGTVVFAAVVGAIALFGAVQAVRVALAMFREVTRR
ncbi:MAG: hypothetical protein ABW067_07775 [Rhizobacter sp.]|jgi:hypothetical protein